MKQNPVQNAANKWPWTPLGVVVNVVAFAYIVPRTRSLTPTHCPASLSHSPDSSGL